MHIAQSTQNKRNDIWVLKQKTLEAKNSDWFCIAQQGILFRDGDKVATFS